MMRGKNLAVDVSGDCVGQVNGLSVLEIGGYSFGKPVDHRQRALGKAGLINIERESNLSGRFHDKGVHIIAGYLRSCFAKGQAAFPGREYLLRTVLLRCRRRQRKLTEVYALLSALSEFPLRQDIAVTGSLNQKGDIQAIGGVNEKLRASSTSAASWV